MLQRFGKASTALLAGAVREVVPIAACKSGLSKHKLARHRFDTPHDICRIAH